MSSITLDIETLSTRPNATILSIAAIKFNEFTPETEVNSDTFHLLVDLDSQDGRDISDSTVAWWGQQDPKVQAEVFNEENRIPLKDAMQALTKFVWQCNRLWCQGPVFDICILENAFNQVGLPVPWQFYQIRDSRTLADIVNVPLDAATHDALADCHLQILGVKRGLKQLNVTAFTRK